MLCYHVFTVHYRLVHQHAFCIIHRVICGHLKGCGVILITHQLQFAQLADNILAIKNVSCPSYFSVVAQVKYQFKYQEDSCIGGQAQYVTLHTYIPCSEDHDNVIAVGGKLCVTGTGYH